MSFIVTMTGMAQNTEEKKMKTVYDFSLQDKQGNNVSLEQFKGKVLLIVNTATGCGFTPQYEDLEAMYHNLKDKGLEILGVAVWDKPEATERAIKQLQLPWPQIINAQKVPSTVYGFSEIPQIMIFDAEGYIFAKDLHGDELKAKVDEIMTK